MMVFRFWHKKTDAEYVEMIFASKSLQTRAVDNLLEYIEDFGQLDADSRNHIIAPLARFVAKTGGYVWMSVIMTIHFIAMFVILLVRKREDRLLVKYYDLALENGLVGNEENGSRRKENDASA